MEKQFKGKAIYNPSGKAGEYAEWACNFYVGCSNACTYCYCKKTILAGAMGHDIPQLKKCFIDEGHALEVFEKELLQNIDELKKHGLFFSFTTDPMLPETIDLTIKAVDTCMAVDVPVKILTKIDFTQPEKKFGLNQLAFPLLVKSYFRERIAIGFTLTGHDELEPKASSNAERIEAMEILHDAGFKTFASIEPVIDTFTSILMITQLIGHCDLYKIGLLSGKKYGKYDLKIFVTKCINTIGNTGKIYFKDSLLKAAGINREDLPSNCVTRDYNLFQ